jgi:leader peptidase (prepilin peptidase)/N-methyltransferase
VGANILRVVPAPPLQEPSLGFLLLATAFGLIVGSFANVVIHRLPERRSVVWPGSCCPRCQQPIRAWDNVPVLSWLLLRGRCRACRARIAARYPIVELANGLLWLALAAVLGPTPRAFATMALVTALLVLSLIDLDHHLLPDAITKPGVVAGLTASFLPGSPVTPMGALLAAAGGYLALGAVARLYRKTRGVEGLGQGDWKMMAMLGAFLGWERMLLTLLLATVAGTVVGLALMTLRGVTSQHALPLGTFLGFAGIAVVFLGDPFLAWYRGLLGA